jgi:anthranilate synthase component 1
MVIPTSSHAGAADKRDKVRATAEWTVHLQAGAGIVADSTPGLEFQETVNKAAALGRAIDLAEAAFPKPNRKL